MAAVAGPIIYGSAAASPAAITPSVIPTVRELPSRVAYDDLSELSGDWVIADGSTAGYTVGAVLNGSPTTVLGTTDHVSGSATVDDSVLTRATIVVEVAAIATDNAARDQYVRDSALDVDDYPTALFTLTSPIALSGQLVEGRPVNVAASGELSLHGVNHAVEVPLTARMENGRLILSGSVPVSFDDYGISPIDLGFVRVDDACSIDFTLAVVPQ
jgi:polyisoprenoid-binding protein YceI